MSLDNFIQVIGGQLLNTPCISSFNYIQDCVSHISRGDLFIAKNQSDIKVAVENGAYAILSDFKPEIIDKEIAWILVDDLDKAIKKLIRYTLIKTDIEFFYLKSVEFEIALGINKDERVYFLSENLLKCYKDITNNRYKLLFIISDDNKLLNDIYPNFNTSKEYSFDIKIISKRLFSTTLVYKKHYFEQIKISSLFLTELNSVLNFFDDHEIEYDLFKYQPKYHFKPLFLSKELKPLGFGESQRVLICEKEKSFLDRETKYLQNEAPWANIKVIKANPNKNIKQILDESLRYYHFILIYGSCATIQLYLHSDKKDTCKKNLFD
ncbi:MAG: hypothetical protein DSZ06_00185 [Sulfurospirillum sp.]|nr:MAG: hypothetical protein DSZ06_00185 [Sulfurospirillum sp.]